VEREKIQVAELLLDGESKRIFIADQPLVMGPTEFNLLQFFYVASRRESYTRRPVAGPGFGVPMCMWKSARWMSIYGD